VLRYSTTDKEEKHKFFFLSAFALYRSVGKKKKALLNDLLSNYQLIS
jgi:hypothetical protein